jgi:hypothetical protein
VDKARLKIYSLNMKHENMSTLIHDYRMINRKTQSWVSKKMGYTTSQFISNCERGICTFPVKKMRKLSKLLGINPELLVSAYIADLTEELKREVLGYGKK